MILLSLGTHEQPFERAVRTVALLAETEELIVQNGHTPPDPSLRNVRWLPFVGYTEFLDLVADAGSVVSHGGTGTIMTSLLAGKTPVVLPRLQRFGEHVDDHQLEIAEALEQRGLIVVCGPGDDIRQCIERARLRPRQDRAKRTALAQAILDATQP